MLLVGIMFVVAMFLLAYRGWDCADTIAGLFGGIFALGVALLPTKPSDPSVVQDPLIGKLHLTFATLFFTVLIIFSMVLFVKSDKDPLPPEKKARNRIYRACGITMIACIVLIALYFAFLKETFTWLQSVRPVFILETAALWAFGISWAVKGQVILKDN